MLRCGETREFVLELQEDQIAGSHPQRGGAITVLIYIAILHPTGRIEGIAHPKADLQTAITTT